MNAPFKNEIIEFIKTICSAPGDPVFSKILDEIHVDIYFQSCGLAILLHPIENAEADSFRSLKHLTCGQNEIQIVHLWEDQWIFHRDKVKSRILSLLGQTLRIHGRSTKIIQLNNTDVNAFLTANHMHVPIKAKYKYGLEKEGETVAVMSFSKARKIIRNNELYNSFELLRFCNKLNTTVIGGFSKLLNHFIKLHHPDDIMTYVDADWSDGSSYKKLGFELQGEVPAMEFWLNLQTGEREYPHMALKSHEISKDHIMSEFDKNSFLQKNNYKKVYNSGSYKYVMLCK